VWKARRYGLLKTACLDSFYKRSGEAFGKSYRASEAVLDNVEQPANVLTKVIDWLEDLPLRSVVLAGPSGSGKTHLASAMLNERLLRHGYETGCFTTASGMFASLQPNGGKSLNDFTEPDLLVIDDLREGLSDAALGKLTDILNDRDQYKRTTLITTNLSIPDVKELIGTRAWSRLNDPLKLHVMELDQDGLPKDRRQRANRIEQEEGMATFYERATIYARLIERRDLADEIRRRVKEAGLPWWTAREFRECDASDFVSIIDQTVADDKAAKAAAEAEQNARHEAFWTRVRAIEATYSYRSDIHAYVHSSLERAAKEAGHQLPSGQVSIYHKPSPQPTPEQLEALHRTLDTVEAFAGPSDKQDFETIGCRLRLRPGYE
jgi:DNA replication protein DnaC